MRGILSILVILAGFMAAMVAGRAQETTVVTFNGTAPMMTPLFKVGDKWELRWSSPRVISISVVAADGSIMAGTSGMFRGSFYLPKGGDFHLQIEMSSQGPQGNGAASPGTNGGIPGMPPHVENNGAPGAAGSPLSPWNIQVVEFGAESAPNQGLVNGANYVPPATTSPTNVVETPAAPTPAPTPAAVVTLTEDQAHAVVLIRGDNAEGTGFLVKTAEGPAVITNLHVISNNPNLRITTSSGLEVTTQGLKGAVDRDLAKFSVKDDGLFHYLDLATDIGGSVQPGDEVITPGNSEGGGVMLNTGGKVLGIGPQRIEIDNPIYHGNSGGPVFHTKSGKVLAVVTEAMKVNVSDELDKTSFQNRNSAISGSMRYFGLRVDTVPKWEEMDWRRFQNETLFLEQFHQESRCLDSFLNASDKPSDGSASSGGDGPPANLYLTNDKIRVACEHYVQQASGSDSSQRMDAVRELLFELNGVADANMSNIQDLNNFYSFDQQRAKDEIDYRKALKAELDSIGDDVSRIGGLVRKNVVN